MYIPTLTWLLAIAIFGCKTTGQDTSSVFDSGADTYQYKRFKIWLDILEEKLSASADARTVTKTLVEEDVLIAVRNVVALGNIYKAFDENFQTLSTDFRNLETAITEYQKRPMTTRDQPTNESTGAKLEQLLERKEWVKADFEGSLLARHDSFLLFYDWGTYTADRRGVVDQLKTYLDRDKIDDSQLYARLKEYTAATRALNGLVQFKDSECPVAGDVTRSTKFLQVSNGDLLKNEPYEAACKITRCFFFSLEAIVDKVLSADGLPTSETSAYESMLTTSVLPGLTADLQACAN